MKKKVLYINNEEECQNNDLEEALAREFADTSSKNMLDYEYEYCMNFEDELYVRINDTQREQLLSLEAQLLGFKFQIYYYDKNNETTERTYMYELVKKNGDRIICVTLDILENYLNKLKNGENKGL